MPDGRRVMGLRKYRGCGPRVLAGSRRFSPNIAVRPAPARCGRRGRNSRGWPQVARRASPGPPTLAGANGSAEDEDVTHAVEPLVASPMPYGPTLSRLLRPLQRAFLVLNGVFMAPLLRAGCGWLVGNGLTGHLMLLRTRGHAARPIWRWQPRLVRVARQRSGGGSGFSFARRIGRTAIDPTPAPATMARARASTYCWGEW